MQKLSILILLFSILNCTTKDENAVLYINGYIFNGTTFVKKDFVTSDGVFKFNFKAKPQQVIDLKNQYVIPPFADAHTHNFDNLEKFDSIYKAYVDEGVFYIQVLNNHYSHYLQLKDSINKPGKLDVAFAHGGITSTGGHPHTLYETQALNYSWRAMLDPSKKEKLIKSRIKENDAYYLIDSITDVRKKWNEIISKKPDIVKLYLSNILDRDKKITDKNIGSYGLSEDVVSELSKLAKKNNILLYAHIESVSDFKIALKHNITHFAHMPGYGGGIGNTDLEKLKVSDSILKIAGNNGVVIIPTVSFAKYYANSRNGKTMSLDTLLLQKKYAFLKEQLIRFKNANITIALGADQTNSTLLEEIDDLISIDAFDNLELLNILTQSSKIIFPNRKLAAIKDGFEASFLLVENNPLQNIKAIKKIVKKVKNGFEIQ